VEREGEQASERKDREEGWRGRMERKEGRGDYQDRH
jgi:hypothetical protein